MWIEYTYVSQHLVVFWINKINPKHSHKQHSGYQQRSRGQAEIGVQFYSLPYNCIWQRPHFLATNRNYNHFRVQCKYVYGGALICCSLKWPLCGLFWIGGSARERERVERNISMIETKVTHNCCWSTVLVNRIISVHLLY